MATEIPFVREMSFNYGEAEQVSPLVRRLVARNPGLFTLYGTNTFLVGRGTVAVIDPGPRLEEHQSGLRRALDGEAVSHVLLTHRHLDHCESALDFAREMGAVLAAGRRPPIGPLPSANGLEEAADPGLTADVVLAAGDHLTGPDWDLEAVLTPGHASDHVCFALAGEGTLLTGDHVMGWSTSVVVPPDGDMAVYRASLRLLQERDDRAYLPGHGPSVDDPHPYLAALVAHRLEREQEILEALAAGAGSIPQIVSRVYAAVDPRLHAAAGRSVLAHLTDLMAQGRVVGEGEPGLPGRYRLASGHHSP